MIDENSKIKTTKKNQKSMPKKQNRINHEKIIKQISQKCNHQ